MPALTDPWRRKALGDVVRVVKGQLITEKDIEPGQVPVIAGGKMPAYFHRYSNRRGKTITISASGASAGYIAFHRTPIFASDCSTISESKEYSIEFVYFLLRAKQSAIYKVQRGGAQPHVHPADLRPMCVDLPCLIEQAAIAAVLSEMDAEIAVLQARRVKIRLLKQGMMQELLTARFV